VANLFFKLLTSKFKFPVFKLIIAIVWNNSTTFYACIIFVATSSTNFGVFVDVVGFLDPSKDDPISCTNLFLSSNSNGNLSVDLGLLLTTCISDGLNIAKEGYVSTLSVCSPLAYRPSCVYYCCCCYYCKWCCKCWKCCGLAMVSIQSSYTLSSKCRCYSPFGNLVSCSLLTS
jgi:hypothetical protein